MAALLELNSLDVQFYEQAVTLLERRLAAATASPKKKALKDRMFRLEDIMDDT